jgi:hypothetical protein
LHNKKYLVREKGTREFAQLGETVKIGCSENEYFYSSLHPLYQ